MGNTPGVYYKDTISTSFLHVGSYQNLQKGIIINLKIAPQTSVIIYEHSGFIGESYSYTNPSNKWITVVNPVIRQPQSIIVVKIV